MAGNIFYKIILCLLLLGGSNCSGQAKTCLDCDILYQLFSATELIRFYHLDIYLNKSFVIIDANHYFPDLCPKSVQDRSILISREIIDKKIKKKPEPLKLKIELVERRGKLIVVSFRYDYEGIVGEAFFNRKKKLIKIIAFER